jgi:pilus assembly protein Flp/PilA
MRKLVTRFAKNDEGAALVEYGLLVGLIACACIVATTAVGTNIALLFTDISTVLSGVAATVSA